MSSTVVGAAEAPGPVDYLVVEFPPEQQSFTGEMAEELRALAQSGTVRVLRVLLATKQADGTVDIQDIEALAQPGGAVGLAGDVAGLMAYDDLAQVTDAMAPGTVAGVVVWENTWAAGFAAAARRAGGKRVASGRIPADVLSGE